MEKSYANYKHPRFNAGQFVLPYLFPWVPLVETFQKGELFGLKL